MMGSDFIDAEVAVVDDQEEEKNRKDMFLFVAYVAVYTIVNTLVVTTWTWKKMCCRIKIRSVMSD